MRKGTLIAGLLSVCVGCTTVWLHASGTYGFIRMVLTEAFPSGPEPTHLARGTAAYRRHTNFLPPEDLERWIKTIHDVGFLTGGYPRRPHPSSFGEAFPTPNGKCPFLYEVDESGTRCSLFNHIDLITYQIFVGGHLSLKFSVKALMAMITQYMIKLKTPVQEQQRYNDTTITMFQSLMEDERIYQAVRDFTGKPIVEAPFPAHVSILPPGTLLHDHLDQPNFRGMDDPRVPRWLIKVMGYSGLFERWRIHDCTFLLYLTHQKDGQFFTFADGVYKPPTLLESHTNDVWLGYTGDLWHGIRMVGSYADNPYDMSDKSISMLSNISANPWTMRVIDTEGPYAQRRWGVYDKDRLLRAYPFDEMRAAAQLRYRTFATQEEFEVYKSHTDDLTVEKVVDVLTDDLVQRGRLKSKDIDRDALAKLLVSEYIRFPRTNATIPLNYCLVYDFLPAFAQKLLQGKCMTA